MKNQNKGNWGDIAILIGAMVYFVSPVDLIPDLTPFGFADDSAILTMAFKSAYKMFSNADIKRANDMASKLLGDNFDAEKAAKMTQQIIEARKK